MNFTSFIEKLNFKKIVIWYLICGIIAAIISVGFLGYTFRDKISFAFSYRSIKEKIEHSSSAQSLENNLKTLAKKNGDIYDILILNNENKIIFTAKNSDLSSTSSFTLVPSGNENNGYFILNEKADVYFKLVDEDDLVLSGIFSDHAGNSEKESRDSFFYKPRYNQKSLYLLNYIANNQTGEKIYFIKNSAVIPNGTLSIKIVAAAAALFFMIYWVLLALWVYKNASKERLNAVLWGLITLFTNIAGLFIFLIYRQSGNACPACGTLQNKSNSYCVFCGTKILESCNHCGKTINQGDRFCSGCGNKID